MAANQIFNILLIGLVITLPFVNARVRGDDGEDDADGDGDDATGEDTEAGTSVPQGDGPQRPQFLQKALPVVATSAPPPPVTTLPLVTKADVAEHARNAKEAAKVAKQAAVVANNVAAHSVKVSHHAKKALKHALGALHDARVDSTGLDKRQKDTLKKAEAHLREATKTAEHGQLKKMNETHDLQKEKMAADLKQKSGMSEKDQMRREIQELRELLKTKKVDDNDIDKALDELEKDLEKTEGPIDDELKAELERLRQLINSLEDAEDQDAKDNSTAPTHETHEKASDADEVATPVSKQAFDIDTQMPYGDLEPFGREDTAQELTESSIRESDAMVDQLERAEVSEEKRAVFRALTRLRGAAITSYDGVARSQTGNIDEYNKIHQWRNTHPLHHLADEESDVSKWAFPDNAD